jgi:hypothetical protein
MHSFAMMWKKTRAAIMGLICVIVAAIPQSLCAQDSVAINNPAAPALGTIVRGTVDSQFRVAASSGAISLDPGGNSRRLTAGSSVSVPTVTISCTNCGNNTVMNVTITSGATIPMAFLISETVSDDLRWNIPVPGTNPLSFNITFRRPRTSTATFKLGFMVDVLANSPTGQLSLPYTVSISRP